MAGKTKTVKEKPKSMVIETPPPTKIKPNNTATGLPRDIEFLGKALVTQTNRINELELSLETMGKKLKRIMERMGL